MKKWIAMLLMACMLLSLTACGGEKGVIVTNDFDWAVQEIYVVPAGAESWGDPLFESVSAGDVSTLSLESAFGEDALHLDFKAVGEDGSEYEVTSVYVEDGQDCRFRMEDDAFVMTVGETGRYPGEWFPPLQPEVVTADYYGVWGLQDNETDYLLLLNDDTWAEVNINEGVWDAGSFGWDASGVWLYSDKTDSARASLSSTDENGNPLGDGLLLYEGTLFVCKGGLDDPLYTEILDALAALDDVGYFEKMGYEIGYAFGDDPLYMLDAGMILANDGMLYGTMPATVALGLDSYNDTQDGYVEIEFTEVLLLDPEDRPAFVEDVLTYSTGAKFGLYDCYTGTNFPASSVYGNSARGDNAYYYEYESDGRTICVDWNFSTNWTHQPDGVSYAETQCFVRMPADYDGIVFGILEADPDFATYAAQLTNGAEEMGQISAEEAANAVFCRINAYD